MEKIDGSYGRIHFVFANEDSYFLDSLVCLDRKRYLDTILKNSGFAHVFFIRENLAEVTMASADPNSLSVWLRCVRGNLFSAPARRDNSLTYRTGDSWLERFYKLLSADENGMAFVLEMETFAWLFREEEKRQRFFRSLKETSAKSILVLTATLDARTSLPHLTDERSIFQSELFPEIRSLMKGNAGKALYEELERVLEGRIHFLCRFTREELRNMLLYGWMIEEKPWKLVPKRLEQYVEILYAWYHSPAFSGRNPELFPDREKRGLDSIRKCLDAPEIWENWNTWLDREEELSGTGGPFEKAFYPVLSMTAEEKQLLNSLWKALKAFRDEERAEALYRRLFQIQEAFTVPGKGNVGEQLRACAEQCLTWLLRREREQALLKAEAYDGETWPEIVEKIIDYLEYCGLSGQFHTAPLLFEDKAEQYRKIVKIYLEMEKLEKSIKSGEERLHRLEKEYEFQREVLRQMEERQPHMETGIGNFVRNREGLSGENLLFFTETEKLVSLNQEKNYLAQAIASQRHERNTLRERAGQAEILVTMLSEKETGGRYGEL